MARKPRLRMALIKCGNCGQRYTNPATHTCRPKSTKRRGRTKLAPQLKLAYTCPSCGKQAGNPLTHVCKSKRGDFGKRRKAAKGRERKAQRDANRHEYADCRDPFCKRFPCKVYREGYEAGKQDGYSDGYDEGYSDGFAAGSAAAAKG